MTTSGSSPASRSPLLRRRWLILAAVLVVAALLRLWRIDSLPPGFHFDESFEGLEAWRILTDPTYRPIFLTGNFGVPPLNAYANAVTFAIFEAFGGVAGPTAMRTTAAICGVLGVLAIYALGEELRLLDAPRAGMGLAFPLFAAAALAIMRWHVHFSRMGIEPIFVPLVWSGANWLLLRGWRTRSWLAFAGCGIVLAAGMYAYQAAWLIPFMMVPVALHLAFTDDEGNLSARAFGANLRSSRGPGLLLAGFVALFLFLPLALFFADNLELIFLRPTQLAIVGQTGSPADNTVWQGVLAMAKMFGPLDGWGDLDPRRNLPGASALNIWLALPFFAGLALALWRVRRPAYSLLIVGLIGLLLPGVLSEYAPHFHRVLGASAPVAMIAALGLDRLWQWRPQRAQQMRWAAVALLALGLFASAQNYFVRWASLPDLFYAFDEGLWEVGQWTASQPGDEVVYITPRGDDHATLAFAWRAGGRATNRPTSFDGRHIFPYFDGTNKSGESYVVIEHEDFRTRLLLPDLLPEAEVEHQILDADGDVYAQVYVRPERTLTDWTPDQPLAIEIGNGISLAGYEVLPETPRTGESVYVRLLWEIDARPSANWTVFTHLIDLRDGSLAAGFDSLAGYGSLTTQRWQPGWRIVDEYEIALPADLPPGEYGLEIGLYQPSGERLPAPGESVKLGAVQIE